MGVERSVDQGQLSEEIEKLHVELCGSTSGGNSSRSGGRRAVKEGGDVPCYPSGVRQAGIG